MTVVLDPPKRELDKSETGRVHTWLYVLGACLLSLATAISQGFVANAEGVGAALAPIALGTLIGVIYRAFKKTHIARWVFWLSAVFFGIEVLDRVNRITPG